MRTQRFSKTCLSADRTCNRAMFERRPIQSRAPWTSGSVHLDGRPTGPGLDPIPGLLAAHEVIVLQRFRLALDRNRGHRMVGRLLG